MKNNQSCQVSLDEQGNAIRVSKNNPEFAHVRITQSRVLFSPNGWVNKKTLSTLVHGKLEDLQEMGFNSNAPLSGKIVVKEQTDPFNEKDPKRDLKMAGDTGIVCTKLNLETGEEQPIYRRTFYDASGTIEDTYISHTNSDEIREANADSEEVAPNVAEPKSKAKAKKQEEAVEEPVEEVVEMEEETFEL